MKKWKLYLIRVIAWAILSAGFAWLMATLIIRISAISEASTEMVSSLFGLMNVLTIPILCAVLLWRKLEKKLLLILKEMGYIKQDEEDKENTQNNNNIN